MATNLTAKILDRNSRLVRWLRPLRELGLAAVYGRRGMARQVNGIPVRVLPWQRWYFANDYDAPVASFLRRRVGSGAVCFSIGANLGVYPLQFAGWSAPGGKVFAFEPNPATAAALRHNIVLNGLERRVHVIEKAVSERPGEATFHALGVDGMSRLGEPNPLLGGRTKAVTVAVESLDHFCETEGIRPDAVMMDVEGFEEAVLRGARALFTCRPPKVTVVEMHPNAWSIAGSSRATMEQMLAEYRMRVVPLSGQKDALAEYGHVALEPQRAADAVAVGAAREGAS